MSLVLKMVAHNVTAYVDATTGETKSESITLNAVYGEEGTANATWSKWTPSGTLKFEVTNPNAFGQIAEGDTYFVNISPASDDEVEEVELEDEPDEDEA